MTTAPTAPGKLGEAIEPALIQRYLDELDAWLRTRRTSSTSSTARRWRPTAGRSWPATWG